MMTLTQILSTKINRYIIPSIAILAFSAIPATKLGIKMLPFLLIMGIFEMLFYFLLVFTIGRLIKNDLLAVVFNLCIVYFIWGTYLSILHWPGGTLHILIGKILFILLIILAFLLVFIKKRISN